MAGAITHYWDGTRLVVTSDSGTTACDLKGEKGDIGVRGCQGAPGEPGTVNIDDTLSISGYAADAAVTGYKLQVLGEEVVDLGMQKTLLQEEVSTLETQTAELSQTTSTLSETTANLNTRVTNLEIIGGGSGGGGGSLYQHKYDYYYYQNGIEVQLRLQFYDSNNTPRNSLEKLYQYLSAKGYSGTGSTKMVQGGIVAATDAQRQLDEAREIYVWGDYINIMGVHNGLQKNLGINTSSVVEWSECKYSIKEV